jgi:hypothetical protein
MDEDTKYRLDDMDRKTVALDKKIDDQGKRFDDVRWFVGGGALIFSVLVAIAGWNYNSERENLREFQKEIRELVSKTDETRLDLYNGAGMDLSGQEVSADISTYAPDDRPQEKPSAHLNVSFIIRNTGDSNSGPMYIKLYTKDDVKLSLKSSDETRFQYEDYATPSDLRAGISSIPAKMSITEDLGFSLPDSLSIKPGRHQALLRVYYGKAKVASAPIYLLTK